MKRNYFIRYTAMKEIAIKDTAIKDIVIEWKAMRYTALRHIFVVAVACLVILAALPVVSTAVTCSDRNGSGWGDAGDLPKSLTESAEKKGFVPRHLQSRYQKPITHLETAQLFTAYMEYLYGEDAEEIIRRFGLKNARSGMFKDTSDRAAELMTVLGVFVPESLPKFGACGELTEQGVFRGGAFVEKKQGVFLLYRFLKALGVTDSGDVNKDETCLKSFRDLPENLPGREYYALIVNHGIMSGSGTKFAPNAKLTVGQMVAMIEKIDRSELKNGFYSYFYPDVLGADLRSPFTPDFLATAVQFPYRGKGAAYLFSAGGEYSEPYGKMILKLPGKKQDVIIDNSDFYREEALNGAVLQLADAAADILGNTHVAFILRHGEELKAPVMIIRVYSPSGKVLSTDRIFAKNIRGLSNFGRIADRGSFKMEYAEGVYRILAIAENIDRTQRRVVAITVDDGKVSAECVFGNADASVRESDMVYSESTGGYVYAVLADGTEDRGFHLVMPNGKVYRTFHIWRKPDSEMKNGGDFDADVQGGKLAGESSGGLSGKQDAEFSGKRDGGLSGDFSGELGGIVETSRGFVLVGAANRAIAPEALNGSRDIFVQIFAKEDPSVALGGEERTGVSNLPAEKKIRDAGVIWLTKLGVNEAASDPKVVRTGDNVIVLWSVEILEADENRRPRFSKDQRAIGYYAVLKPNGDILKEATELPRFTVPGRTDSPVDDFGVLYWVSTGTNGVRFVRLSTPLKVDK